MIAVVHKPTRVEQLLLFDVGNSSIHVGVWSGGAIRAVTQVRHDQESQLSEVITQHWRGMTLSRQVMACSVVPSQLVRLKTLVSDLTGEPLLVVGNELPVPISNRVEKPETVGMDRLCCAAAAYGIEQAACVIADVGTAVTVDCVSSEGYFIGGAILPGLSLQSKILAQETAQLPVVSMEHPGSPLGQSTEHAIRAGLYYGCIGAIRQLVESYAERLGRWPALFLTGGDSELLAADMDFVDKVVPDLCLRGVVLAYQQSLSAS